MKKKQMLATLVMLSLLQGSVYAANEAQFNDFFDVGRNQSNDSYFKTKKVDGVYQVVKDNLAGERDTVNNNGDEVTFNIYSEIERDENTGLGTIFYIGNYKWDGKKYVLNFHNDAVFDGGVNDSGVGQSSFYVGGYDFASGDITINLDDGKTFSVIGTTNITNNNQMFHIENGSTVNFNNGNLYIEHVYPTVQSDYEEGDLVSADFAQAVWIENESLLNVNNDSVKILKSFNQDEKIWSGFYDAGLEVVNSTAIFTTKEFFVGSSNKEKYESFDYGLWIEDGSEVTINANKVDIYGENGIVGERKGKVEISGDYINIYSNDKSIWAVGDGSNINITGAVNINGQYNDGINVYRNNEEKNGIALVAGKEGTSSNNKYGEVNINLKGTDNSYITGDIIGARNGVVNINSDNYNGELVVHGDILAGNGGTSQNDAGQDVTVGAVNFDLGNNGYLEGRVDDYQDADLKDDLEFFDPHFTDGKVNSAGTVNLTMGEGSKWNVTGQSWVTTLDGENSVIDLRGEDTDGYAVHIGELTGNNTFVVNLNADKHEVSDMIYIGKGTDEQQTLEISNERELLNQMDVNERLRFATVAEAGGGFGDNYTVKGRGIRNVNFDIEYVDYNAESEQNELENNSYNNAAFGEVKPGTDYVDKTYGTGSESNNVYLVRTENDTPVVNPDEDLTDSGKTVINMSRANYKNAIYMDRLNKRLGEARYINGEEDQGMWVRLRHDRIGQSGDFRSMNTMYELGYDEKQDCDNGERRIGFAVDYMRGSTTYSDILGKGETKRYGLWLYDTWLGDKGHYADYVLKWGHLSNDFDIRDKESFERVTGDYSNNVFSASAEYGRKKDLGNDWYIEPQAQLQLARVTGAEYTTTMQDTKVSVDGINSLIGRAGFRLGRDLDERSTVYVKADLLHEFLGDQTITATDPTGSIRETFENKGTWYDVGFGFATAMGKNSYAFMDFEKSFGNDNDETYQINAGVRWTF